MSNQNLTLRSINENQLLAEFLPEEKRMIDLNMNHLMRMKEKMPQLNASDFFDFIRKAQLTGADPMLDQVYLIPQNQSVYNPGTGKKEWRTFGSVIFSYHFFISKAETNAAFDGYETEDGIGEYFNPTTGEFVRVPFAVTRVYRKDRGRPIEYKAWFPEFAKKTKDGSLNTQWAKSPMGMLRKCSLCNALKQAFPHDLASIDIQGVDDVSKKKVDLSGEDFIEAESDTIENQESETVEEKIESKKEEYIMSFPPIYMGKKLSEVPRADIDKIYNRAIEGVDARTGQHKSPDAQGFIDAVNEFRKNL